MSCKEEEALADAVCDDTDAGLGGRFAGGDHVARGLRCLRAVRDARQCRLKEESPKPQEEKTNTEEKTNMWQNMGGYLAGAGGVRERVLEAGRLGLLDPLRPVRMRGKDGLWGSVRVEDVLTAAEMRMAAQAAAVRLSANLQASTEQKMGQVGRVLTGAEPHGMEGMSRLRLYDPLLRELPIADVKLIHEELGRFPPSHFDSSSRSPNYATKLHKPAGQGITVSASGGGSGGFQFFVLVPIISVPLSFTSACVIL